MTAGRKRSSMAFIVFLFLLVRLPAHSETLKISATGRSFTQLPIRIAQVKGFYRDEELEVVYVQMTGQLATASLFGGHVDATTAFSASATAYVRGLDAKGVIFFCDKPTFIWFQSHNTERKKNRGQLVRNKQ